MGVLEDSGRTYGVGTVGVDVIDIDFVCACGKIVEVSGCGVIAVGRVIGVCTEALIGVGSILKRDDKRGLVVIFEDVRVVVVLCACISGSVVVLLIVLVILSLCGDGRCGMDICCGDGGFFIGVVAAAAEGEAHGCRDGACDDDGYDFFHGKHSFDFVFSVLFVFP